jgi:predicted amidohydrolase
VGISVTAAQVAVTWDVEQNLASIAPVLDDARPDEVVVFPEGALSGYGADLAPLGNLDPSLLACAIEDVAELARERAVHVFCGSLIHEDGAWWNAALYFSPSGRRWTYKKINLAMNERGLLAAGDDLPTLEVRAGDVPVHGTSGSGGVMLSHFSAGSRGAEPGAGVRGCRGLGWR